MGSIILHHDVGKLTKEYQDKKFFRHEAISAHILYRWLLELFQERTLPAMLAAAVYLHHEGLQIAHRHFEMREPTYGYLINWLSPLQFCKADGWNELISQINQEYLGVPVSFDPEKKTISGFDIAESLGAIMINVDGCSEPLVMRMGIAAVLHPLTVCDNLAANKRGGTPSTISKALAKFFDEGALAGSEE
jgi:CRISPR-associated endonuclease Cas3-HD